VVKFLASSMCANDVSWLVTPDTLCLQRLPCRPSAFTSAPMDIGTSWPDGLCHDARKESGLCSVNKNSMGFGENERRSHSDEHFQMYSTRQKKYKET
jgi:hypothetical protein